MDEILRCLGMVIVRSVDVRSVISFAAAVVGDIRRRAGDPLRRAVCSRANKGPKELEGLRGRTAANTEPCLEAQVIRSHFLPGVCIVRGKK